MGSEMCIRDRIDVNPVQIPACTGFQIAPSVDARITTGCPPDAALCRDCQEELFNPDNRRYRYPFINCTQCGPRLSVIRQLPYDRVATTMQPFQKCRQCEAEYHDPGNRRFYDQATSCPACGPRLWLEDNQSNRLPVDDVFQTLREALTEGKVVALKGMGGFYLVCDATSRSAVSDLRLRKQRPDKPFALMVRDMAMLNAYADFDSDAEHALRGTQAPVVLLEPVRGRVPEIAPNVAPGQYQLGFMLPYSPLHQLLFEGLSLPLVMTSGNRSGQPQAIDNQDARAALADIADLFLMHDREIHSRLDDSVLRASRGQLQVIRKGRGYAPDLLKLPPGFEDAPELMALGGELKNTLCFIHAGRAVVSQHLGDLGSSESYTAYEQALALYTHLYRIQSRQVACDLHPEYRSSKLADSLRKEGYTLVRVQHHHAHLAACLGENAYPLNAGAVLGICLDGSGFGSDGTLWGGEFLLGDYRMFNRVAQLKPFPLLGGTQAILQPWRLLYAQLRQSFTMSDRAWLFDLFPVLNAEHCAVFENMLLQGVNTPQTSSAGRLFDAVAAALGCHGQQISYEGQAAIELETLARAGNAEVVPYPFTVGNQVIDPAPMWRALINDLQQGVSSRADMALAFHKGLVQALTTMTQQLAGHHAFETIALTGGVMQNMLLLDALQTALSDKGFRVLTHRRLPANDGGLSFGQALVAAVQLLPE